MVAPNSGAVLHPSRSQMRSVGLARTRYIKEPAETAQVDCDVNGERTGTPDPQLYSNPK